MALAHKNLKTDTHPALKEWLDRREKELADSNAYSRIRTLDGLLDAAIFTSSDEELRKDEAIYAKMYAKQARANETDTATEQAETSTEKTSTENTTSPETELQTTTDETSTARETVAETPTQKKSEHPKSKNTIDEILNDAKEKAYKILDADKYPEIKNFVDSEIERGVMQLRLRTVEDYDAFSETLINACEQYKAEGKAVRSAVFEVVWKWLGGRTFSQNPKNIPREEA